MSYQRERDTFIATVTREGLPLWIAERLLREATGFQRRAELACSSEAADRDRVPCPANGSQVRRHAKERPCLCDFDTKTQMHGDIPRITLQDWRAEERLKALLRDYSTDVLYCGRDVVEESLPCWMLLTAGDPRGYTLRIIPPSYAAENATRSKDDPRSIGVPARDSRLRF